MVCFSACVPPLRIPRRAYRAGKHKHTSSCTHAQRGVGGGRARWEEHGQLPPGVCGSGRARCRAMRSAPLQTESGTVECCLFQRFVRGRSGGAAARMPRRAQTRTASRKWSEPACARPAPSTPLVSMGRAHPRSNICRWCAPLCAASRRRRDHAAVVFAAKRPCATTGRSALVPCHTP